MSGNFEVCPAGTLQRLAQVEAEVRSMRLCFEVTELERSKYKAEREALKTENERLNGMLTAASWHRAQEEHNALRAKLDALVKERDEDRRREYGYSQQVVDALTNERGELRAEREALLALIADDAFASSFQTMAQYRSALLNSVKAKIQWLT